MGPVERGATSNAIGAPEHAPDGDFKLFRSSAFTSRIIKDL
ncbi:hypothetical protein [Paraburkholderia kirstenboschensis]|uniref:Uncharacterized protein n=1 Tax=Paraburkholderia kirstenboschensis TaxID=1245436 RepID=A0ABZ0ELR6_9BURK|nr:hypothetical protein [Paraburkholderia kirstenboschensis]WOD17048.1 hypothetical protein RW095_14520 [Paraburkholderia kirstenboschensis]